MRNLSTPSLFFPLSVIGSLVSVVKTIMVTRLLVERLHESCRNILGWCLGAVLPFDRGEEGGCGEEVVCVFLFFGLASRSNFVLAVHADLIATAWDTASSRIRRDDALPCLLSSSLVSCEEGFGGNTLGKRQKRCSQENGSTSKNLGKQAMGNQACWLN